MKTFDYIIKDENGIHARPAGALVKKASEFRSDIRLSTASKKADAKRIFSVMSLGAKKGQTITVETEGPDEDSAADAMLRFLNENI